MAKLDFSASKYGRLFGGKDGVKLLRTILNNKELIGCNYGWWKTQGVKDSQPTAVSNNGSAVFEIGCRSLSAAPLMDQRAPLGDALQEDSQGSEWYSASIPHFIGKGTVETAMERKYKEDLFKDIAGADSEFIAEYVHLAQRKIDSVDATLNYMHGRLISTGKLSYKGIAEGIQSGLQVAKIPAENFVKSGKKGSATDVIKAWTDPDCNILKQMADTEAYFRDLWGTTATMVWKMPKSTFENVFLKNKFVQEFVKNYRTLNYMATAENIPTTMSMWNAAKADLGGCGVSQIEIVEEKERNVTATSDTMIHGWEQSNVVLCPVGPVCTVKWCDVLDEKLFGKYGADNIKKTFAKANMGLSVLVNTEMNNGQYKEWHTDIMMSAVPALNEFLYHVIVDITKTA